MRSGMEKKERPVGKIEEVLESRTTNSTFNALHSLLNAIGLECDLELMHEFTFFAPPDEAFSALRHASPYEMLKDVDKLRRLLAFHIAPLKLTYADLGRLLTRSAREQDTSSPIELATLASYPLHISLTDRLMIDGASIIQADVPADNGVIHVIDHVLWPPGLDEESFKGHVPFYVP
jgi:uncharacterized surface protein with fasciclin (FAS1) repeats